MTAGPVAGEGEALASPAREPIFVGRDAPLAALVAAVQAAELGERVLGLVAGEPGIGKTRLVKEMAGRVSAPVLCGTCWEGDGAPPYWVWLQLLRALRSGEESPTEDPEHQIDAIVGEVVAAEASSDNRFRLFDVVTELFATASQRRPLVLVLEDLHWADEASVRLLEFLARDPRPRRLAVIGTYRDTDLDRTHPFARRLGELVRDGLHLSLGGLAKRDVGALLAGMGEDGANVQGLIPLLHRKSGGNPFFLRELVRLWHDEGRLDRSSSDLASAVPPGMGPVVALRISKLTRSAQDVLSAAAVGGTTFELSWLGAVTGLADGDLLDVLDEARTAGLVTASGSAGTFSFVHAVVREVLYEGLGLAARATLHAKIADALEAHDAEGRLPEIAHHVLESRIGGSTERALELAVRAGEQSFALLAYEQAADWYGRALEVLPGGERGTAREAELLIRRGEATLAAGDMTAAREAYERAAVVARGRGDADQLARASLGLGAGLGGFEVQLFDPLQVELLEEALSALDPGPSPLRVWVLARLSVALSFMDAETRRRSLSEEAVDMARRLGDPSALGYALAGHCDAIPGPDHCEARRVEATEVVRLAHAARDRPLELLGRRLRLVALAELGDIAEVDVEIEAFARVAEQLRQPLYRFYVPLWRGMRDLMRGDLGAAARHGAQAQEIGALAHSENARILTFTQWWVRRRYEGEFTDAGRAMVELLEPEVGAPTVTPAGWPYLAVAAAQLGEHDRARALLEQWLANGLERRTRDSEWLPESAQLAEAAVFSGCREVAALLYDQLRPYADLFCVEGIGAAVTGSVASYLGLLAHFLGDAEAADAHEEQATVAHRRVGLVAPPPLSGFTRAPAPERPTLSTPGSGAMTYDGAMWAVTFSGRTCRLADSKGVRDLAVLLARPGREVHCLELVGGADVGSAAGPVLDEQARRAYERRIRDLQGDIDEASAAHDPVRAERAEAELDALVHQLSEAFGLSGRARTTGSAVERARSAVRWRIRAALRHADEAHPALGRHLQNAVHTGTWCSYRPEGPVTWKIEDAQGRRA